MILKCGYITSGMDLITLLRLLFRKRNHDNASWNFLRLATLVTVGIVVTLMGIIAFPYHKYIVARRRLRTDPVIIVGHWRTGSTYLHELLTFDTSLKAPSTLQCTCPIAYPVSRFLIEPFMMLTTRGKRPMDNVRIGPQTPQEDEFALFRLTGFSPLSAFLFPHKSGKCFLHEIPFLPINDDHLDKWKSALVHFVKMVQGRNNRRVVLKNPFNSLRIDFLRQIFPDATFIHINRNPESVIPSTLHMWSILGQQNSLKGIWQNPSMEETVAFYNHFDSELRSRLKSVPKEKQLEVSYEALEHDPLSVLVDIYKTIEYEPSEFLKKRWLRSFAASKKYKKNNFALTKAERNAIRNELSLR